jgi:hypothetical protein
VVVADPGPDQEAAAVQPFDQLTIDRHPVIDDQRIRAAPVLAGDAIGDQFVVEDYVGEIAEHVALDLGVILEQRIGHQYLHCLIHRLHSRAAEP